MAAFMAPLSGQPLIPVFIRGACTKRGGHENVALKVRSIFISLKRRRGGREACKYSARDADNSSSSPAKNVHYVGTDEGTGIWRVELTWSNCSHTPLSTFRPMRWGREPSECESKLEPSFQFKWFLAPNFQALHCWCFVPNTWRIQGVRRRHEFTGLL